MTSNKLKNVLVVVNQDGFNIDNQNSAVAGYLRVLSESLSASGFVVDFFPVAKKRSEHNASGTAIKKKNFSAKIKKVLRESFPILFHSLSIHKLLTFQKTQAAGFPKKEYSLIIEFYTIGSDLTNVYSKQTGAKLLVIYDNPVLLQFKEMFGSKTIFDSRIIRAEKNVMAAADCILTYSKSVEEFVRNNHKTKSVFHTMPCIVWKAEQSKPERNRDDLVIGFIGSFLNWHKVPMLLKAFEKIALKFPKAKLSLVGYGEEWNKVYELREKSSYKERIYMPGFVSEDELQRMKDSFAIGVMPGSNWYGSPLKLFEYAQCGIPIIAPSTPAVLDLFRDGETAVFIDAQNEDASLVSKLDLLLSDKPLRERLGENARNVMKNEYSKETQMHNFVKLVQKLTDNGIEK